MDTSYMNAIGISEKILRVNEPLQLDPSWCVGFRNKGGVHVILKQTIYWCTGPL